MFGLRRKRPHFRTLPAEVLGSVLINPRRIPALLLNPPPMQEINQVPESHSWGGGDFLLNGCSGGGYNAAPWNPGVGGLSKSSLIKLFSENNL